MASRALLQPYKIKIHNSNKNADKLSSAVINSSWLVATKVRNPIVEKLLNLYSEHENKKKTKNKNN